MTILHKILQAHQHATHATNTGTQMHARLQHLFIDGTNTTGDKELVSKISENHEIAELFTPLSQTEVPIAGTINGKFISRRIDRLTIDSQQKLIKILDYKTDINRDTYHDMYIAQIREYASLLHALYPNHKIIGYILWTHDFSLEKVTIKPL